MQTINLNYQASGTELSGATAKAWISILQDVSNNELVGFGSVQQQGENASPDYALAGAFGQVKYKNTEKNGFSFASANIASDQKPYFAALFQFGSDNTTGTDTFNFYDDNTQKRYTAGAQLTATNT